MPQARCPRCKQIVTYSSFDCDYVHNCDDFPTSEAISQEDVQVVGPWSDADGTTGTGVGLANYPVNAGLVDIRLLTEGHVDDPRRLPKFSLRGSPTDTTRARSHYQYIKVR